MKMISFCIALQRHSNNQAACPFMLMILFLILSDVQSRILVHSDSFTTMNDWQVISNNAHDSRIITCGASNVLFLHNQSPTLYTSMYFKTFEIQPHYKIESQFQFWMIDQWNNYFIVYYDNVVVHASNYVRTSTSNLCEVTSQYDEIFALNLQQYHYGSTISLGFLNNEGKFGISDFELYIYECPIGCFSCNENSCFYQFLYLKSFDSKFISTINTIEGWSTNDIISTLVDNCVDTYYHKSTGNSITKEITLIEHEAFSLYIRLMVFNSDPTKIYLKIDDTLVSTTSYSGGQIFIRDYFLDNMTSQQIKIQERHHIKSKIKITIDVSMNKINTSLQTWFGIRDFKLFLTPYNLVADMKDTCDDSNIYPFDGCFSKMYDCVQGCSNCIFGVCNECQGGWEYLEALRKCYPICGDSIITSTQECDDGNVISNDGCDFCKLSCSSSCKTCEFEKCLECQKSYILIDNSCLQICEYNQDYYVQKQIGCYYQVENFIENGFQQHGQLNSNSAMFTTNCQIYNYQIFSYQYQICSIFRVNNCKFQYYEDCIECLEGYHLEKNKKNCISSCDDGIITETEVCDDNNNIQFDKCYKCQLSCQLECLFCINEKCLVCLEGWQLIDYICVQECGDGIIAKGSQEQCDDANEIDKDGCYQCMWQCSPYCKQCINQYLCSKCIDNFELISENDCKPICGDNIVIVGLEECDDGNELPFDGCYECQFQCQTGCIICEFGVCQQSCNPNQIIVNGQCKNESEDSSQIDEMEQDQGENEYSNNFKEECGNGIKSQNEECDDGNNVNNDGCSNTCFKEENWNCTQIQNVYSKCFSITQLQIFFLNQSFEYQYVQISYDKQVKTIGIPEDFISTIKTQINVLDPKEYKINIYPVNKIRDDQVVNINYQIEIVIYNSFSNQPKLTIAVKQVLIDENQLIVNPNSQSILLKHPKFMNSNLRTVSQKLKNFSNILLISLSGSSLLMLLCGYSMTFFQILDILQYQSTLRYINLDFPQNVQIFFESSDFVTLQPILISLQITNQFDEIIGQEYISSFGRFLYYKTNADLLTNMQGQLIQLLAILALFSIHYFQLWLQKYIFTQKFIDFVTRIQNKLIGKLISQFYKLNRIILNQFIKYSKEGFIQIFLVNSWDLILKVLLYISSNSNNSSNYRTYISKGICLFYLVLILSFLIQEISKVNKFWQQQKEQQISILLIKKLLFLIVLIEMQQQPLLQTLLLSIIMSIYLSCIILMKQGNQNSERYTIISTELSLITFTLLGLAYCQEFQTYFSPNTQFIIGFVQITIIIIGLLYPLFKCFKQFFDLMKKYVNKKKNQKLKTKTVSITTNIFQQEQL